MKFKSIFFLIAFTWCIFTPAIVTICHIDTDISTLFSLNEEEIADAYKLGAKEYYNPDELKTRFLSIEALKNKKSYAYKDILWETPSQENLSPPPEHV